jgi:pimeloyl-ACP methyl ester carboxylesterase
MVGREARTTGVLAVSLVVFAIGCTHKPVGMPEPLPNRSERIPRGYLFYLDGAGGGAAYKNYAQGVRAGLLAAKYPGAGEMFTWETGKGLMADQKASVKYKRSKAAEVAREIAEYAKNYPGAPISVLGFSAGTAVAIFTLEALPETVQVDHVVLLGASVSQDYDLTRALKRVKEHLYLYTSTHDRMIGFFMPFSGTADRKYHDPAAGIKGFLLPKGATDDTRKLYAGKIVTIPWTKELEKDGDYGHHFDNVKMEFIRDHVVPLFMDRTVPGLVK